MTRHQFAGPIDPETDPHGWFASHHGLPVVPLRNPVLETLGHHPASRYAERYWLPTLGPTACWLHRNLVTRLEEEPDGVRLHLPTIASEVGVGTGTGRNAPIIRALSRLRDFHVVEIVDDTLGVHMMLPPLSRRQAASLPEHLAVDHRSAATAARSRPGAELRATRPISASVAEVGP